MSTENFAVFLETVIKNYGGKSAFPIFFNLKDQSNASSFNPPDEEFYVRERSKNEGPTKFDIFISSTRGYVVNRYRDVSLPSNLSDFTDEDREGLLSFNLVGKIGDSTMTPNHLAFRMFQYSIDEIGKPGRNADLWVNLYAMRKSVTYLENIPEGVEVEKIMGVQDRGGLMFEFDLVSNVKEAEEDIKSRLFRERILPKIKNYFDNELDWEKLPDDPPDAGTEGRKFKARRNITPVTLRDMRNFVHSDEHIDVMFDNLEKALGSLGSSQFDGKVLGNSLSDMVMYANAESKLPVASEDSLKFFNFVRCLSSPNIDNLINAEGANTYRNILFDLGFLEIAKQAAEEAGIDVSDVNDAPSYATAIAQSALGLVGSLTIGSAYAGEVATEDATYDRMQCALMSGLLHGDFGWEKYWTIKQASPNDSKFISPLGYEMGGNNRIYPVKSNIAPSSFMNKAIIGSGTKDTFKDLAEDEEEGTYIRKQLWWVYGGSVYEDGNLKTSDLRERRLFLSSEKASTVGGGQSSKALRALEIYWDNTKTPQIKQEEIKNILGPASSGVWTDGNLLPLAYPTRKQKVADKKNGVSEKEAKLWNEADYYFLESINVVFKGTNPSTARNDVTVEIKFQLSSLNALTLNMDGDPGEEAGTPKRIKLHDLITLSTTQRVGKTFGQGGNEDETGKEYSPEVSRLRLKMQAKNDFESNLIIDLSTIDYDFSRSGGSGLTTMTVNYRGYFESMMNMPDNDIFLDDTGRENRRKATMNKLALRQALRSLPPSATTEERVNAEKALNEARDQEIAVHETPGSPDNILRQMKESTNNSAGAPLMHSYTFTTDFETYGKTFDKSMINETLYYNQIVQDDGYHRFFFLGDLMWVLLGCIYKPNSADHIETMSNLNVRYMVAPIDIETSSGVTKRINPLSIPIDEAFFRQWFTATVINKGLTSYRTGIFIRDLLSKLVNSMIDNVCTRNKQDALPPPRIKDIFISTSEEDWYKKDTDGELDVANLDPFLKRSIFYTAKIETEADGTVKRDAADRKLKSKNYCIIYPRYSKAFKGIGNNSSGDRTTTEGDTLKMDDYTPEIFYGKNNKKFNFVKNVSFSKTNTPFLREARYSRTDYGALSLLANVYDLSLSFVDRGANTLMFPGIVFNFVLLDFDGTYDVNPYVTLENEKDRPTNENKKIYTIVFGNDNPHDKSKIAHVLGFGGYYMIHSVTYTLGQTHQDFEIKVDAKFNGSDGLAVAGAATPEAEKDPATQAKTEEEEFVGPPLSAFEGGDPTNPGIRDPEPLEVPTGELELEKKLALYARTFLNVNLGATGEYGNWAYSSMRGVRSQDYIDKEIPEVAQNPVEYATSQQFAWGTETVVIYSHFKNTDQDVLQVAKLRLKDGKLTLKVANVEFDESALIDEGHKKDLLTP